MEQFVKDNDLMNRIGNISLRSEQIQRPMIQKLEWITIDMRRTIVSKDNNPIELSLHDYECLVSLQPSRGRYSIVRT